MVTYKNIRVPKRSGGTRLQRVQVLKSGKYKFVKNLKRRAKSVRKKVTRSRSKSRSSNKKKSGGKRMAKNFKIPLALVGGIAASPAIRASATKALAGDLDGAMLNLGRLVGFWEGNFSVHRLFENLGPIVVGGLVSKFVGGPPLNLNRKLAQIPFIKL